MNMYLLECKRKATLLVASEDAPRNDKGSEGREAISVVMKELWEKPDMLR